MHLASIVLQSAPFLNLVLTLLRFQIILSLMVVSPVQGALIGQHDATLVKVLDNLQQLSSSFKRLNNGYETLLTQQLSPRRHVHFGFVSFWASISHFPSGILSPILQTIYCDTSPLFQLFGLLLSIFI